MTRWAGHHPWLVRLFIVSVLLYVHAWITFIPEAEHVPTAVVHL